MLFHNTSRLQPVNPCYIGYTCANCVIKQKQLQAMLVNTLSNNNYQHIMEQKLLFSHFPLLIILKLQMPSDSCKMSTKCNLRATMFSISHGILHTQIS